jgi:hypothetical protein
MYSLLIFEMPSYVCLFRKSDSLKLFYYYGGRLKISWTRFIIPSRNIVEVRWRSFWKYLPWQAMHFLQRSTHFPKTCCRPLMTSKFLASELHLHGWKSPEIAWGEIWTVWRMFWWGFTDPLSDPFPPYSSDLASWNFWAFPTMKRELRGKKFLSDQRSAARFREVGGAL